VARYEIDREDLLREATALVERIELHISERSDLNPIVVGFRSNGAASVFFGSEPVYHFNSAGELRRAFCKGALVKVDQGRLVEMQRYRQTHVVELQSRKFTDAEQQRFIDEVQSRLRQLASDLRSGQFTIVGQVPAQIDILGRVLRWISELGEVRVATIPRLQ
jgi:hypothetical protein